MLPLLTGCVVRATPRIDRLPRGKEIKEVEGVVKS